MPEKTHLQLKKIAVKKSLLRASFAIDRESHDDNEIIDKFMKRRIHGTLYVGMDPDQSTIEDFETGLSIKTSFDCGKVSFDDSTATFGADFDHKTSVISHELNVGTFQSLISVPAVFEIEDNTPIPAKKKKSEEPDPAQTSILDEDTEEPETDPADTLEHEDVETWEQKSIALLKLSAAHEAELKENGIETLIEFELFLDGENPNVASIVGWNKARKTQARKKLNEYVQKFEAAV